MRDGIIALKEMRDMIINYDNFICPKCKKGYDFDTSKTYRAICSECGTTLKFLANYDMDTEKKPEKVPEMTDAQFQQFLKKLNTPKVCCPYCRSTRCSRISILGRMISVEFWGLASNKLGKQWHCEDCGSTF